MLDNRALEPLDFFHDITGDALASGYIYYGEPDRDAEAYPITVYWDNDLSVAAAQPLRTIAGRVDNSGTPAAVYIGGDYSIKVKDSGGVTVYSILRARDMSLVLFSDYDAMDRFSGEIPSGAVFVDMESGNRYLVVSSGGDFTTSGGVILSFRYRDYDAVSDLLDSVEPSREAGAIWKAGGFNFTEVSSGEHLTTAGGVGLTVNKILGEIPLPAFDPSADGATDDTSKILAALSAGPVNGFGLTCAVTEVELTSGDGIKNINLVGTDSTKTPLKIGDVGAGALYDNTGNSVRDVTISGVGDYAFVFSNMTQFDITDIKVTGFAATQDLVYMHRMYGGVVAGIRLLGASTAGTEGAAIRLNLGVNGLTLTGIYTSCFVKYGVVIDGDCNSNTFPSPVLQGHSTGFDVVNATGVYVSSPYFENVVNAIVIGSGAFTPKQVVFQAGGYLASYSPGHTFQGDDNGVIVMANRGVGLSISNCHFAGVTSSSSGKRMASVNNGTVLTLIDPTTASGDTTEVVTDFLYKETGALGTSGYYVEDTGAGGENTERTTVARSNQGSSSHVISYRTTGTSNFSETLWSPAENT